MMRFAILILSIFFSSLLGAQSLFEEAKENFENKEYEEGLKKINKALSQNAEVPDYYRLQGDFYDFLYQTENAAEAYFKAITLEIAQEDTDPDFLGNAYYYLSGCYLRLGQFQTSIRHCRKGLYYKPSDKIAANLRFNLASSFVRLGEYDSAMYYLNSSYEYDLKIGDSVAIATDLNSLGFMQAQKGAYKKALKLYEKSMSYLQQTEVRQVALRLSNIGMMQYRLGDFEEAERNFLSSKDKYVLLEDSIKIITQLTNLGKIYKETNRWDDARRNLEIANDFFEKTQNVWLISRIKLQLGQLYLELRQPHLAIQQVEQGIEYCQKEGLLEQHIELLDMKEKVLLGQNKELQAYSILRKRLTLVDSLAKKQQLNKLNELELEFMTQIKEKQLQLSEAQNQLSREEITRKERSIYFLVLGSIGLIIFFLVIYILQKQKMKLKESLHSKEVDELRLQISTLLGQENETTIPDLTLDQINDKLIEPLSDREYEVLRAISSKMSNKEIAESIFVSINTVKFHLKKVYEKLGVSNRKEALHFLLNAK